MRYEGMFDWIALGDDDTTFMYNRAKTFLKHIDHTQVRGGSLLAVKWWQHSSLSICTKVYASSSYRRNAETRLKPGRTDQLLRGDHNK